MLKITSSLVFLVCFLFQNAVAQSEKEVVAVLRPQILREATWALTQQPVTVTAETSSRSAGGKHDFYSEGDYWWPNPVSPDSPYIQKDGMTNPENFVGHRHAMIRFSRIVGALASAYKITGNKKYAHWAMKHCNAWFVNPETMMNPSLLYAQAIKGRATGRGIGIIDAIHLMEVVQGLTTIEASGLVVAKELAPVKKWFQSYLNWLNTHKYGKDEMNAENNHGTCWVMQAAAFAKFTGDQKMIDFCTTRFKTVLLPKQMAPDGSFPLELRRTKPYGYSIFNLDAMTTICQLLSSEKENLWTFTLPDGRSMQQGLIFLYPYLADKSKWPYKQDVMYWNNWPVAQPALLFGALAYMNKNYFNVWKELDHASSVEEVIRNLPVRNPLLYLDRVSLTPKKK